MIRVSDLRRRKKKLSHNKIKLDEFLSSPFNPPPTVAGKRPAPDYTDSAVTPPKKKSTFDTIQSDVVKLVSEDLVQDLAVQRKSNIELDKENKKLKETNRKLVRENDHLKEQLRTYEPSRVNQMLKRKGESNKTWRAKHAKLKSQETRVDEMEEKLKKVQEEIQRLSYAKTQMDRKTFTNNTSEISYCLQASGNFDCILSSGGSRI